MAEMLKYNHTIRKLLLSSNLLGRATVATSGTAMWLAQYWSAVLSRTPGDSAVGLFAESLTVNTGLEMLLLADNPFGDEGGQQLTSVLCGGNQALRVLDLHGSNMSRQGEREVRV